MLKHRSLLLLVLAASTAAACTRAGATAEPATATPVSVSTTQAKVVDLPTVFETGGIVHARLSATIASRVMAPVTAVHVTAGSRVRRGQALVELDAREMRANRDRAVASQAAAAQSMAAAEAGVDAARAALTLARATHQRIADLAARQSATPQELDQAVAGLSGAEAQLRAAEAQRAAATSGRDAANAASSAADTGLSYATLTAPFDGVVSQRLVDPGTMATPGAPLLVLEDPSTLNVEATLDESRAAQVQVGSTVDVSLDAAADAPAWRQARVEEIARVDPASHSFVVKVGLPQGSTVRSGTYARVRVTGTARRALTAPASAIVRRGQLAFVYVVAAEVAHLRAVSTAAAQGTDVEILAGLVDAEVLVAAPPPALTDGRRVQGAHAATTGAGR